MDGLTPFKELRAEDYLLNIYGTFVYSKVLGQSEDCQTPSASLKTWESGKH
jgi:hypothetical protein